jgi:hypothetical protein
MAISITATNIHPHRRGQDRKDVINVIAQNGATVQSKTVFQSIVAGS